MCTKNEVGFFFFDGFSKMFVKNNLKFENNRYFPCLFGAFSVFPFFPLFVTNDCLL